MTAHTPEHVAALLLEMTERQTAEQLGISRRQVRNIVGRSTDLPHKAAAIEGVTAEHSANAGNIWQFAIDAQKVVFEKHARKQKQAITLPDEPVAIAFLSDLHIGSAGTDYQAIKADAELIRDTPGMYAGFHGDGMDNFIIGKLQALQRGAAVGFDAERILFESWIDLVAPKLLWWVEGNHDLWTEKLVGVNPNRAYIDKALMLDGENVDALLERANLNQAIGNSDAAVVDWIQVMKLAPDTPSAKAAADSINKVRAHQAEEEKTAGQAKPATPAAHRVEVPKPAAPAAAPPPAPATAPSAPTPPSP